MRFLPSFPLLLLDKSVRHIQLVKFAHIAFFCLSLSLFLSLCLFPFVGSFVSYAFAA